MAERVTEARAPAAQLVGTSHVDAPRSPPEALGQLRKPCLPELSALVAFPLAVLGPVDHSLGYCQERTSRHAVKGLVSQ